MIMGHYSVYFLKKMYISDIYEVFVCSHANVRVKPIFVMHLKGVIKTGDIESD